MNLEYNDIIEFVKARLDELSNNDDASLVAASTAVEDLEKIVDSCVLPAVRKIHLDAPNLLLKSGLSLSTAYSSMSTTAITGTNYYKVNITLKTNINFLRLVTLKMSEWARPIQTLFGEDGAEYRKQGNKFLMGTPNRPAGFLLHEAGGEGLIELYSVSSSSPTLQSGMYISEPEKVAGSAGDYVYVVGTLKASCLNQITADVLRCIGRHQEAEVYDRLAIQPFNIEPDYLRKNPVMSERVNTTK